VADARDCGPQRTARTLAILASRGPGSMYFTTIPGRGMRGSRFPRRASKAWREGKPMRFRLTLLTILAATVFPAHGQTVRQLTDHKTSYLWGAQVNAPVLDDAGTTVWGVANLNPGGVNPTFAPQLFHWDAAAGSAAQLVRYFPKGVGTGAGFVSVGDDGTWIAFVSDSDLRGQNHDLSREIYVMRNDGTQLTQVTNDPGPISESVYRLVLAGGASKIVFESASDLVGTNPSHFYQLYVVNRDGT